MSGTNLLRCWTWTL